MCPFKCVIISTINTQKRRTCEGLFIVCLAHGDYFYYLLTFRRKWGIRGLRSLSDKVCVLCRQVAKRLLRGGLWHTQVNLEKKCSDKKQETRPAISLQIFLSYIFLQEYIIKSGQAIYFSPSCNTFWPGLTCHGNAPPCPCFRKSAGG